MRGRMDRRGQSSSRHRCPRRRPQSGRAWVRQGRSWLLQLEILGYHEAGITVPLPKPMTSGAKSEGRFGKQDFAYLPEEDAYRCPAGEQLPYRFASEEDGKRLR